MLDERVGARIVGGIVVAIAGSILLSTGDFLTGGAVGPAPSLWNALAVVSAVAGAGYVLAGRSVRPDSKRSRQLGSDSRWSRLRNAGPSSR